MTTLVLGTVGSMVGGAVGGPIGAQIGWLAGSLIGNLIDPPKVEGPRRTDLKLQLSEYGKPIPIVYGTGRLAGNVIDQTDLQEHKHKSGGKGGPQVTTYTYSASFAIMLCEGPIMGVLRIWADGRLIYDLAAGDELPCTVYLGDEDQEPDPTFEAIHGVGAQPAYRGYAYVVFTDYYLTDFGDRIPQLEFEVFTQGGDIPWRVSSFTWTQLNHNTRQVIKTSDGNVKVFLSGGTGYTETYVKEFATDGTQVGSDYIAPTLGAQLNWAPSNLNVINCRIDPGDSIWYLWNDSLQAWEQGAIISTTSAGSAVSGRSIYKNNFIYAARGSGTAAGSPTGDVDTVVAIYRFECPDKIPGGMDGVFAALEGSPVGSTIFFAHSDDDYVWVITINGAGAPQLYKFDADLNLIHLWTNADLTGTHIAGYESGQFMVYNGMVAINRSVASNVYNIALTRVNGDHSLTDVGVILSHGNSDLWDLEAGLGLDTTGIFSLNPPPEDVTLASVVAELSDRTQVGGYDVAELEDDIVHWYAVGNQMTVRNAIEPLRRGYLFDAVESDYSVVFRKRGATDSVVTIDDDDLDAREYGAAPKDLLVTTRKKELGLPRTVTLRYIDIEADYQTGAQSSPRIATNSDNDTTLDLSIGFGPTEALQKCWALQVSEWVERESFQWNTGRKYAWVDPCDVVTVRGRVVRVTKRTESPNGIIQWEGVQHRASVYTQEQVGTGGSGFVPQTSSGTPVPTQLVLLDIPILSQNDPPFGFYAAMGPASVGLWSGATLFKSIDGGGSYTQIGSTNTAAIIGVTASSDLGSPPGSPTVGGSLGTYSGGDVVDESSICVRLTDPSAELESITSAALEAGGNYCAISFGPPGGSPYVQTWEICQFRDAVLIDEATYVLTGFKRGRKGSSTAGHAAGDTFVLLSTVVSIDAPQSDIDQTFLYKAVTAGKALADTSAQYFTNTGLGAEEYYNVEIGELPVYGENGSGSPTVLGPGVVPPPPNGQPCDPDYFLNQCGEWAIPAGTGGGSGGSPSSGGAITVKDEGATLTTAASTLDFTGAGVTATYSSGTVTINIPGGGLTSLGSPGPSGTYGGTFSIPIITVDDYGRVTSVTTAATVGRIQTLDEGSSVDSTAIALNFTGNLIEATNAGAGVTTVNVSGISPSARVLLYASDSSAPNGVVLQAGTGIQINESGGSPATVATISSSFVQGGFSQSQLFTSSGTFNVPSNVSVVFLTGIGGGGAGGGIASVSSRAGGGGGAGQHGTMIPVQVTGGGTVSVTVPAAATGVAGAAGNNGGDVTFGSLWTFKGGSGGSNVTTVGNGGAGGGGGGAAGKLPGNVGTIGTQESIWTFGGSSGGGSGSTAAQAGQSGGVSGQYTGSSGGAAGAGSTGAGGGGGASSPFGQGGTGGAGGASPANGVAASSTAYGAGGGGGGGSAGATSTGGDGAPGFLLVTWYGAP